MTKQSGKTPAGMAGGADVASAQEIASLLKQAVTFHRAGALPAAEQLYRRILAVAPNNFDALHLLGVVSFQRGDGEQALQSIDAAIECNPRVADAHNNRGNVLTALRRFAQALASYDRAIAIRPDDPMLHLSRANALTELKRNEEAVAACDRCLALKPDLAPAWYNRGNALAALKRAGEAIGSYEQALKLKPDYVEAHNNCGGMLQQLGRYDEALICLEAAIALRPDFVRAYVNRGITLSAQMRHQEALASFERALALAPDDAEALNGRGIALSALGRCDEALESYGLALAQHPGYADAWSNRGTTLQSLKRLNEALSDYDRALAIDPEQKNLQGTRLHLAMQLCDWRNYSGDVARLLSAVEDGVCASPPFGVLPIPSTLAQQRRCAEIYAATWCPPDPARLWRGERYIHDRIRIAYLSADFYDHATAHLMAGLFECHDRARFEVTAVSFSPPREGEMRARLMSAFERFTDVRAQSDQAVATMLRAHEIDIAVDLKGFTQDARTGILAKRPAPIQVSYIGYPGTMSASYIDYLVADDFVVPESASGAYSEAIVRLPDSYQVNDWKRRIAEDAPSRDEVGLPGTGFVFCCFNTAYKITPEMFDVWMRLLHAVEGSVLWLLAGDAQASINLRREAEARSIAPGRLIFAPRVRSDHHLARQRLADLFLDTFPYNAHTTASDALWAGLPVLTYAGTTFASRVAGSLLTAVGLPELITGSLADYEQLALKLATDRAALADLKASLARTRHAAPLFDTVRTTRAVEAAYIAMWERWQRGEPAVALTIDRGGVRRVASGP
jgi:protein O-GlcNAc transferase